MPGTWRIDSFPTVNAQGILPVRLFCVNVVLRVHCSYSSDVNFPKHFTEIRIPLDLGSGMIQLVNVCKNYGDGRLVHALRNINLDVAQGERVAVMGPSGSGKSSLLNLICGLDEPTSGAVKIDGVELSALSDDARTRMRREKVGMIFQTFNLLPTLTAHENVALPLRLQGLRKSETEERALAMLERVGLKDRATHRPDELSGGERQRVAIARALIFRPPLLLGDEPTGNLDSATGEEILSLLASLHSEFNTTLLMVTHNNLVSEFCDRTVFLRDGQIVQEDPCPTRPAGVS
jgi:putative ABC transport system ATP-binding protein